MAQQPTEHDTGSVDSQPATRNDEVLRLTWAVLDGVASDEDRRRLGELVDAEYAARREYLNAVQLNNDLAEILRPRRRQSPRPSRSVSAAGLSAGAIPIDSAPVTDLTPVG